MAYFIGAYARDFAHYVRTCTLKGACVRLHIIGRILLNILWVTETSMAYFIFMHAHA
jgi:hypothetical protein